MLLLLDYLPLSLSYNLKRGGKTIRNYVIFLFIAFLLSANVNSAYVLVICGSFKLL